MTDAEAQALQLLRQIDQKLEKLLQKWPNDPDAELLSRKSAKSRAAHAQEIADLTPTSVRQTDSAELLREDRLR
jgi:hypothetical protein